MNQPEFYTAIGFDEPVDINELSEENRKFFFEQFSPKPVKKNDPAVNAETNVGSTNNTVSLSVDGSLDLEEEQARRIIQKDKELAGTEEELILQAKEKLAELRQDISNQTTRREEADEATGSLFPNMSMFDKSSFKGPLSNEDNKNVSKDTKKNSIIDDAYYYTLTIKDIVERANIGQGAIAGAGAGMPYGPIGMAVGGIIGDVLDSDKPDKEIDNELSTIIEGKKILKDPEKIRNFNLIKENRKKVAINELAKQGNKNISDEQYLKYIKDNKNDKVFQTSVDDLFINSYIKAEQKEAIIKRNTKESGWDGFTEGDSQNRSEEAAALIASNLDKQAQSNIATSVNIDSKIQKIDQSLKSLQTLKPRNQEEANLIIEQASLLIKDRQGLIDAYGDVVNKQIEIGTEAEDIRGYLDTVSRNQGWLVNPVGALVGGAYDFVY